MLPATKAASGRISELTSLGNEEFHILYTHGLETGTWNAGHRFGPTAPNAWAGLPAKSKDYVGCILADSLDEMALALRLLIEEFGGEATRTALIIVLERRLMRGNDTTTCSRLGRILDELASCEAITLEDMDEAEIIVRIASHGVVLAYK